MVQYSTQIFIDLHQSLMELVDKEDRTRTEEEEILSLTEQLNNCARDLIFNLTSCY